MPFILDNPVSDVPISPYFTWDKFVNRFGLANIIKVSNKDKTMVSQANVVQPIPTGQPNWYAVQDAFNYATDKIHSILRGGILAIPLSFVNNGNVVPDRVGRWAMIIAYCDLLDMRTPDKVPNFQKSKNSVLSAYASELDEALMDVAMHKDGIYRQMPEAVHIGYVAAEAVQFRDVIAASGQVRYVDGTFTFWWGSVQT